MTGSAFAANADDAPTSTRQCRSPPRATFYAAIVKVTNEGKKWTQVEPGSVGFGAH